MVWKQWSQPDFRYCANMSPVRPRKGTINLRQISWCCSRDSNMWTPKYAFQAHYRFCRSVRWNLFDLQTSSRMIQNIHQFQNNSLHLDIIIIIIINLNRVGAFIYTSFSLVGVSLEPITCHISPPKMCALVNPRVPVQANFRWFHNFREHILGCDTVWSFRWIPPFWGTLISIYKTLRCHRPPYNIRWY
jgi:hypothetical protein